MNEKIIAILKKGNKLKDLPKVIADLRLFDEAELFNTLFPLSIQAQGYGFPVAFSAYALNELNPKCPIGLKEAVEKLLPSWDSSLEEVVFYLVKQFGIQVIKKTLDELLCSNLNQESILCIRTVTYWIGIYGSEDNQVIKLESGKV